MQDINTSSLSRDPSTIYHLEGDGVNWHTGHSQDDDQLLAIMMSPDDLIIRFGPEGDLKEAHSVPEISGQASELFPEQDDLALQKWLSQIGFRPGLISVRRFILPEYHVGISDLPSYYRDILLNPTRYSPDEQEFARREISRWSTEGLFELILGEHVDIWIDKAGRITAT